MRTPILILITCASAAMAGAACSEQVAVTYTPPTSREFNGGAEGYAAQTTANRSYDGPGAKPRPVYAVIAHHVVSGNIQPRSRLLTIADERQPQFVCEVSHRGADVRLACSDGTEAQLKMPPSGCGHSTSGVPASLCIGYGATHAARRLTASPGETVAVEDGHLTLRPSA